jgi:hypothetical protein
MESIENYKFEKRFETIMKIYKKAFLILICIVLSGVSAYPQHNIDEAVKLISSDELMKTVEVLASEEFAGRLSGSPGYNMAADYINKAFQKLKLKPAFDDGYYQFLNVEYNEIMPGYKFGFINQTGNKREYKLGKDFVFRGFTGSGNFTAEAVFCGYGISQPEIGYNDYENIDVKDKVVIVFKGNPGWRIDTLQWNEGFPRQKANIAASYGAKGILFVSSPANKNPQAVIGSVFHGAGEQNVDFPQLHIEIDAADELLSGTGFTLKDLQLKIDSLKKPYPVRTNSIVELNVNAKYEKEKGTMNVAALLEGFHPELKNEYIIIAAHLDHVGSQAGEIYFPGANDNASGSAAVLEIARAFSNSGIKPARSIIFALLASEEQGLHGAEFLASNPPIPVENITAMINLDCVGYGDSIQIGNGKSSPLLWEIAKRCDSKTTKLMVERTWSGGGADATPFHYKGIPSLYFVTTNSYEHLHKTTDLPATLNKKLFEKITQLAFLTLIEVSGEKYIKEEVRK